MHGLIIRRPWIDCILDGRKTWELRGTATRIRGKIALIQGGSGLIVGACQLVDVIGPLSTDDLLTTYNKHGVRPEDIETSTWPYVKTYAWVLQNATRLPAPLPYHHPPGAVIWVRLPDNLPVYKYSQ